MTPHEHQQVLHDLRQQARYQPWLEYVIDAIRDLQCECERLRGELYGATSAVDDPRDVESSCDARINANVIDPNSGQK